MHSFTSLHCLPDLFAILHDDDVLTIKRIAPQEVRYKISAFQDELEWLRVTVKRYDITLYQKDIPSMFFRDTSMYQGFLQALQEHLTTSTI